MLNDMYRYTLYCFVLHKSTLSGCSQQKNININSSVCLIGRRGEHTFAIRLRRFQIVSLFACLCLVIRELRSTILSIYILCCVLRHFHTHTRGQRGTFWFLWENRCRRTNTKISDILYYYYEIVSRLSLL